MSALAEFTGGLLALLIAGHLVVRAASMLGARFGLSPMVIGLTIVAAGTSAPELAVVGQAIAADDTELAVGSIIGSNIANVLLVLGIVALLGTIHVTSRVVRIDIPVMIAASTLFLLFALDGTLGRVDGIILFGGLVLFVTWTLRATRRRPERPDPEVSNEAAPSEAGDDPSSGSIPRAVAELIAGIAVLAVAARFVVSGAEEIAGSLGVPELIVGLTIVALGTSAPEIVTTLVAAFQGRRDLAVGNAVGSNIFNILLVLGAAGMLAPSGIAVSDDALQLDLPILLAAAVACLPIVAWDYTLNRWEGAIFVAYYLAYLTFLVLDATGHRAKDPFALIMIGFVVPLTIITAATVIHRQRRHRTAAPRGARPDEPSDDHMTVG
jgi:cation:H+ antiporter